MSLKVQVTYSKKAMVKTLRNLADYWIPPSNHDKEVLLAAAEFIESTMPVDPRQLAEDLLATVNTRGAVGASNHQIRITIQALLDALPKEEP